MYSTFHHFISIFSFYRKIAKDNATENKHKNHKIDLCRAISILGSKLNTTLYYNHNPN